MEQKELSIVVTSYRNAALLRLCLESIRTHVTGIAYEVLVADGETQEETETMMREIFPETAFFPSRENLGLARLFKKAIGSATGRYLLYMNGDIIVTPGSVQLLLAHLKTHPDIGLLGPQLLNFNETFQYSCFRFYKPWTILYRRTFLKDFPFGRRHLDWFLMKDYDHREPKAVDWLMGSVLLTSREALERVGPMDERFFLYMEDVDWCRRFWETGYQVVYFPASKMYHYHGKGSARGGFFGSLLLNRLTWYHIKSAARYFFKYWGKPLPRHD